MKLAVKSKNCTYSYDNSTYIVLLSYDFQTFHKTGQVAWKIIYQLIIQYVLKGFTKINIFLLHVLFQNLIYHSCIILKCGMGIYLDQKEVIFVTLQFKGSKPFFRNSTAMNFHKLKRITQILNYEKVSCAYESFINIYYKYVSNSSK